MARRAPLVLNLMLLCSVPWRLLTAADLSAPASYEGQKVLNVRFDPPAQPIESNDLNKLLTWKPGDALHLTDVRAAIKRLFATGAYASIDVDTEAQPGGVGLVIHTTDQWFVGPVEVRGKLSNPPNAGQLASAAGLELGTPFDDKDLDTATKGLQRLLERNGLYKAEITPNIERDQTHQEISITFNVDVGKRARLTEPVITGDTKLPPEEVAKATKYKGWFKWSPATDTNTQAGVRNILNRYAKKKRLTATVSLKNREYVPDTNRVRPHIQADGGPVVNIKAQDAKVSQGTLKKYVPVFEEQTVNNDLLVNGAQNLRDYFQFQGYFDVQVDFKSTNPTPDQDLITYTIGLGERRRVADVIITGNHYFKTPVIKERLYTESAGFVRLRHGRYSEGFGKRDHDAIVALYKDNGFRDVKVAVSTTENYKGKAGDIGVTFAIDEGPQYRVSSIQVLGLELPDRDAILKQLASVQGEPFGEVNVSMDRNYLITACQSAGYPDVTFKYRAAPVPGTNQMAVEYDINQGDPATVREVLITGMHLTRERLIKPAVEIKAGDPLSWTTIGDMQRKFYNFGVFDAVDVAIQDPDGQIPDKYVLFHVTEGDRYHAALGLGAEVARFGGSQSSISAPAGTTGFAPNVDLELSRMNLWGLGHSLNFKGRYSTLDRQVSLNYLAPRYRNVDGRNISFTALYDNTRDVLTFTAVRYEGSVQVSQKLSKPTTLLMRYTWRDSKVDTTTLKINPLLIPLYAQSSQVAEIGGSLVQDRRDDPSNARRGIYNSADVALAEDHFGGNRNFLRVLVRNSYYKSFGLMTLASNTEFGVIHAFSLPAKFIPSTYIPLPERFFGGGSNSMRGFPDEQAGPRDPDTGFPIGGNALLFHSTELRFPLIGDNIGGVVFHDLGNIYQGLSYLSFRFHQNGLEDFNYMVHAVGFGIRYRTPLGPVRLDLAYSINPPTFNGLNGTYHQLITNTATPAVQNVSHFQFFFSIGQAF